MVRFLAAVLAFVAVSYLVDLQCQARGGGGRGGGGGGARNGGGTRVGRTTVGRNRTVTGRTAKDWALLRDQEERQLLIQQCRERLMDLERKKQQEAFLAAHRRSAADRAAHSELVR